MTLQVVTFWLLLHIYDERRKVRVRDPEFDFFFCRLWQGWHHFIIENKLSWEGGASQKRGFTLFQSSWSQRFLRSGFSTLVILRCLLGFYRHYFCPYKAQYHFLFVSFTFQTFQESLLELRSISVKSSFFSECIVYVSNLQIWVFLETSEMQNTLLPHLHLRSVTCPYSSCCPSPFSLRSICIQGYLQNLCLFLFCSFVLIQVLAVALFSFCPSLFHFLFSFI